jgi:hypothetical protein
MPRKSGVRISTDYDAANLRAKALDLAIKAVPLLYSEHRGVILGATLFKEAELVEAWLKKAES